jgi:hypothetical protein
MQAKQLLLEQHGIATCGGNVVTGSRRPEFARVLLTHRPGG